MSKPRFGSGAMVRITFLVMMGLTVLLFGYLFLAVFVPVVGWYLWTLQDRVRELERKLAPPGKKTGES